ncbi:Alanine--tRNA ligase [Zea mays]|uniref:alanine--tRNA ligase n=1 Tax=Zea mays TaxID=4577 RepID=A0A317Y9I1_MAIZE|nr:Alanine--tRNA ligase [Zea mays]
MAGETGPCGPCIGFFLDCSDNNDGVDSVRNITDGKLVEICRLVFVEFDRQADGVLEPFQAKHVLTGINLECLAAILQKKQSHYDLDVYAYVIRQVYWHTGKDFKDYTGKVGAADTDGVDTAYRLVADHMRMIAVTNAPGSQLGLGNEGREYFLKCADKQAVKYGYQVLKINEEDYDMVLFVFHLGSSLDASGIPRQLSPAAGARISSSADLGSRTVASGIHKRFPPAASFPLSKEFKCPSFRKSAACSPSSKILKCSGARISSSADLGSSTVASGIHKRSPPAASFEREIIDRIVKDEVMIYKKTKAELEQNLELSEFNKQVLGVLPKLTCSLYFDVTFSSSCGLEKTFETALFGFLGVPLRHGWLVDPQDAELDSSIRRSSYSKLSYNLAIYESIRPKTNSGPQKHGRYEDDMFYSALAFSKTGSEKELDSTSCATISTFLQGPQLTRYGFSSLHNDLRALQPTVLIWNKKLITISKANGDGVFVDCNFVPTDSKIQSVLPLTKTERKKRIKEKMDLKKKEKDSNKDKDDEDTKDRDDEETEEKDDGNAAPQTYFLQGRHINLNVRPINFLGLSTHVIHQINDGPCALIAVCNVLLLRGDISFEPHETVVSMEYLLGLVLALLGESVKMQDYSDERKSQILDVVKSLAGGFDMDVIFTRTDGFTMTPEWLLLDCLDLNLRHNWIAARDLLTGPEVSFESLTLASNEPGFPHAKEIKNFLRGPQLTPIGLVSLQEDFVENVPCILFWNKHYHTIVMVKT